MIRKSLSHPYPLNKITFGFKLFTLLFIGSLVVIVQETGKEYSSKRQGFITIMLDFEHAHPLQKDVYGLNQNLIHRPFYLSNSGFIKKYNELGKPAIRYPGGTTSNYLNLKSGWAEYWPNASEKDSSRVEGTNRELINAGKAQGHDFTQLAEFQKRTQAKVTYVLNMSTMSFEENRFVLDSLKKKGAAIAWFEIGNELYYGQYKEPITNVDIYISKAKQITALIREYYPTAKVGVLIPSHIWSSENFLDGPVNDENRQELWYSKIQKEDFYDAVIIHMYANIGMDHTVTEANFLPYLESYKYCISHVDANFDKTIHRISEDFMNKEIFITEYHVGGFGGAVRKYRLRYSYLGALMTANFMLKMFHHENITLSSWHSMAQMLEFERSQSKLLVDDYHFGTTVNYCLFKEFKEPVLHSNCFSSISIDNACTYNGIGELGQGEHLELSGGNFFNTITHEGYVMVFNKQGHTYHFDGAEFEKLNQVSILDVVGISPEINLNLEEALKDEKKVKIAPIKATETGYYLFEPFSFYKIKYARKVSTSVREVEEASGMNEIKVYSNPSLNMLHVCKNR